MNNKANVTSFKTGHVISEDVRKKISESKKGKRCSTQTEFKKGFVPHNKGRGAYVACKVCGKLKWFQDWQLKHPKKGKFCSKECCYKGQEFKGTFQKGHADLVPKDKRGHTEETKKKISIAQFVKRGRKKESWNGPVTPLHHQIRKMDEYREWRLQVIQRDKWICQTCGNRVTLHAHHIKSFSQIIAENDIRSKSQASDCDELWSIENGITLCEDCHNKIDCIF